MMVLGLKAVGHDTGAALIANGRVVAIAEERLNRIKHSPYMFPRLSIDYCLAALGVEPEEIDLVVADQVFLPERYPVRTIIQKELAARFTKAEFKAINHHDAHAASAFFCSPFSEAAVLIHDGAGEAFHSPLGVVAMEAETTYYGTGNKLAQIQKTTHLWKGKKYYHTCGPGKIYDQITDKYLAFGPYNEGKLMGLAPYGTPKLLEQFPLEQWFREFKGQIYSNPRVTYPPPAVSPPRAKDPATPLQRIAATVRKLSRKAVRPLAELLAEFSIADRLIAREPFFAEIRLPRPPRDASVKLPDDYYASVAYAVQAVVERIALTEAKRLWEITRAENLCVAGGIGLNIDANRRMLDEAGFKHIFIQPGASDTGIALGAALFGYHALGNQPRFWTMQNAAIGRSYTEAEISQAIEAERNRIEVVRSPNIAADTAKLLADGNIIGWFQGGSEYGPRALGNRSILCDARGTSAKDTLNDRVKHRESWRPFGASVLAERSQEYFELGEPSPFMLLVSGVHPAKRSEIPAVVHIDGTCRTQTVTREANGRYYDLIAEFARLTGMPLILNTSFNLAGEPIVETPADALKCFLSTQMDNLVLGDYLIAKR